MLEQVVHCGPQLLRPGGQPLQIADTSFVGQVIAWVHWRGHDEALLCEGQRQVDVAAVPATMAARQ